MTDVFSHHDVQLLLIDVSGGVLSRFHRIIDLAARHLEERFPRRLRVMLFDHALHDMGTIASVEELRRIEARGGGGTDIAGALEKAPGRMGASFHGAGMTVFTDGLFLSLADADIPQGVEATFVLTNFTGANGEHDHVSTATLPKTARVLLVERQQDHVVDVVGDPPAARPEATPEGIADLAQRCREILTWRRKGIYVGTALEARAKLIEETGGSLPMREAEDAAVKEALTLCAGLDEPRLLAEGLVKAEMGDGYDDPDRTALRNALLRVATAALGATIANG